MTRCLPPLRGLYAVTPELGETTVLVAQVSAALAGGVRWVQYRNKAANQELRLAQARALAEICGTASAALIINDDVELALAVGAAGVHLGVDDGDPVAARAALGCNSILGISCYAALDAARRARSAGADYVAFGAMFASPTKPAAVRAPLSLLTAARAELGLPIAAIGGITLPLAASVLAAGADMLAVISDLFDAPDDGIPFSGISRRAREYQQILDQGSSR